MLEARLAEADRMLLGDERIVSQPGVAAQLYAQLAAAGSGLAASRLATLAALGVGRVQDWGAALNLLAHAAGLGEKNARRQLAALAGRTDRLASGEAGGAALWRRVREEIDLEPLLAPPPAKVIAEGPAIRIIEGFAPPAVCAWLVRAARNRLAPGVVNDAATGERRIHAMRTAKAAPFNLLVKDVVIALMQERAARATGAPAAHHEPPNVIAYQPGEQFERHYDFIDPASPHFQLELMLQGQRVATCVTYLNDDFEGGETDFPRLNWRFKGKAGDALIFSNVARDGRPDPRTLHAGLPPTRGRKWVFSQWLRDRTQQLC